MNKGKKSKELEEIEFVPLEELLLPDNDKIKKIKSLYQKEVEYLDFLGPIEFFIANYGQSNPKIKDKDVIRALRKIRDNWNKNIDFFKDALEYNIMMTIGASLQTQRKITKHELLLVIKHVLWAIDNRKWIDDNRAYINWIANFFHILDKNEKRNFDAVYNNLEKKFGLNKEEIRQLKGEDLDFELPVEKIELGSLDSENFDKSENELEDEESFWSEGSYIQSIDADDPGFEEKIKYFDENNDSAKDFKCKKCEAKVGKHNLYWHEGMCNNCFFDNYFPDTKKDGG